MEKDFPIPSIEWHFVHKRVRSPLYTSLFWEGLHFKENKRIPFDYSVKHVLYLGTQIAMDQESWDRIYSAVKEFTVRHPNALHELLHDNYEVNVRVEKFAKETRQQAFTPADIKETWNQYRSLMHEFGSYALLPLYLEGDLEQELKEAVKEKYSDNSEEIYQILTTPLKAGSAQQEELAMLRLAIAEKNGTLSGEDIHVYLEEFAWITNNSFIGKFLSADDVRARLAQLLANGDPEIKLQEYQAHLDEHVRAFTEIANSFNDNPRLRSSIDLLQESIYFRSWRTERFYRNAYFLQNLFSETAHVLGLANENDIFYFSVAEIIAALDNPSLLDSISFSERRDGYFCLASGGEAKIYSGEVFREAMARIRLEDTSVFKGNLKGQCAFKGKVRGVVSVVITKEDLSRVTENSILVSPSTTVDYVPALKKVIGIITEEGGVLSHASVISRELRIPCVIGTKIATQVLHNGDVVELDAEQGVITVLSKYA